MIRSIFIAFVLSAAAAQAQDIQVRSGEHDGYTRLVAQVPPGTSWVLSQTKSGARLSVELDKATFNTGSVFRRLTKNRLAAISQSKPGGALEMQFGCDCVASAFLFKNTMIVVDIAPGTALPPISAEIPPPVLPKAPKEKDPLAEAQDLKALELPLLGLNAQRFENQLSTLLLRGADRDLVDLNLAPIGPRLSVPEDGPPIPPDLNTNIHVTSVLDGLNGLLGPSLPQLEKRPPCISSAELGFDRWSGAGPFPEQVASLRGALFQEFDRIDKEKALKLARLYAYSGFGAEALQALDLLGQQSPQADRVAAIARYLDDGQLTAPNPFTSLQRCESDAALWALLIDGRVQNDARLQSIEQSFVRLPDHLRRHVGPTLAEILTDADKLEAARRVLRAVDRVESEVSTDTSQAKAKVAAAEGDGPRAEALLNKVITSSDADLEAPLALARLVDKRWAERGSISPQELDLAAAYVVELRRSELEPLMTRTQIVALSLSHEFDEAVDLLDHHPSEAESIETLNRVAQILTERADDATFLRRALTLSTGQRLGLTTETAVKLAERLVTLGFAEAALDLASRPQDKARRAERARLRARAALLKNRPHQAMLELADDPSDTAQLLRGNAMQAIGDYVAAGEHWRAAGEHELADRFFWLADRTEAIDDVRGTKFVAVNQTTMRLSKPPSRVPDKPLADAHNLLADSTETRRRISELLMTVSR
ncbi:hypothetical protein [Ruegeria sp. Ofav3-42]|uniref:hypothetical protein n=1 Tax=Ruegeria sp. Ofav3-42 TaxID=2917759 RepID=UPI001EF6E052|nr:hypothetical protein [Ruegeria sp. Ofav3-42]MCG7521098.1 hypothetical protein [Ruegeria sp. Ofav3-42]